MPRDQLLSEIIQTIIESVNLHHLDKATINAETPITTGGLELDSVDILELVVAMEQRFGVRIQNAEMGAKVFKSIGTVADFIESQAPAAQPSPSLES